MVHNEKTCYFGILATREVIRLLSIPKACQKNAVNFTVTVLAC